MFVPFSVSPASSLPQLLGDGKASQQLLRLLLPICKTVVEEREYVDRDFRSSYANFYYLRHNPVPRTCTRLHFFAEEILLEELTNLTESQILSYLGFLVIRPLAKRRLGRSYLSPSLLPQREVDEPSGIVRSPRITCTARHRINLAGNRLPLNAVPWIQQDGSVSRCASAALWIVNSHMAERFPEDFKSRTTAEITEHAAQYGLAAGRTMPSDGLTVEQMSLAMRTMGYEPILKLPQNAEEAARFARYYTESGIPVIAIVTLGTGADSNGEPKKGLGHALALVGHAENSAALKTLFVAQDDSTGPFKTLRFTDWREVSDLNLLDERSIQYQKHYHNVAVLMDHPDQPQELMLLRSFLVGLPERVTLPGDEAERKAKRYIQQWYEFNQEEVPQELQYRTFLQASNGLKHWWSRQSDTRPPELGKPIRTHPMSKWVWVTEFSLPPNPGGGMGLAIGQVAQDSAGDPSAFDVLAAAGMNEVHLFYTDGELEVIDHRNGQPWHTTQRIASLHLTEVDLHTSMVARI